MMNHFKIYCDIALSKTVVNRALKVSLIVGTILNLINQGSSIINLDIESLHLIKLALTYLVPYSVTTYTATAMKVEFQIGTKAVIETDLQCKECNAQIHVQKEELIPQCNKCGIHTRWALK